VDHFCLSDRSGDIAHAQLPFQVTAMWSDWVTHISGTGNRRRAGNPRWPR